MEKYRRAGQVTECFLAKEVNGVRLTQRTTNSTLGFRSFPGGAQRIQVGQVAIVNRKENSVGPFLLTNNNRSEYRIRKIRLPTMLPESVPDFFYAERLTQV
jgi:hypothetical protein